jgi:hypothetical protein
MDDVLELARAFLDRRTSVALLATVGQRNRPDICVLAATHFTSDGLVAGGEEEGVCGTTFKNLRQSPLATIVVLDPVADPRARDGVRLTVEFLGAESDGDELSRLHAWLQAFAPGRRIVRRLLFKVLAAERYRSVVDAPVIRQTGSLGT